MLTVKVLCLNLAGAVQLYHEYLMLAPQEAVLKKSLRNVSVMQYARFIQSWINMIVVDDGQGASCAMRKGRNRKMSLGKKYSTQTTTNLLVLHGSE